MIKTQKFFKTPVLEFFSLFSSPSREVKDAARYLYPMHVQTYLQREMYEHLFKAGSISLHAL